MLVSVAGAGGLYGYNFYLKKAIAAKSAELEQERAAFAPALIEELRRLDSRFKVAQDLLNAHTAPTQLFDLLSRVTVKTVELDILSYQMNDDGDIAVILDGTARNFASLALQSEEFNKESAIREPVFSNFSLDDFGNVLFQAEISVNPLALSYIDMVNREGVPSANAAPADDALSDPQLPDQGAAGGDATTNQIP